MRLGICMAAVLAACTAAPGAHADLPFDSLTQRWKKAVEEFDVPGLAVAVVSRDEVLLLDAFGHRDATRSEPATPETMYYVASVTKSFTALAVLQLADRGLLELDAPVTRYLPRFELAGRANDAPVTLRDLLSHRRGLVNDAPISFHEAYTGHPISEDFFYSRMKIYVEETGEFSYGNIHFTLLGRVIRAVTGEDWNTYVQRNIVEPLGMDRTTMFASVAARAENVAAMMYREASGAWREPDVEKVDGSMSAAGGTYSTARDLARWVRLHMNDGALEGVRIVDADLIREGRSAQAEVDDAFWEFQRPAYGMGWYVGSYAGETLIHCFGAFTSGARAHLSYMPERDLGVVVLTNVAGGPGYTLTDVVAADVYDAALGRGLNAERLASLREKRMEPPSNELEGLLPPPSRGNNPAVQPGALTVEPEACVGAFENEEFGRIRFYMEDGQLFMQYGGIRKAALIGFREPNEFVVFVVARHAAMIGEFIATDGRVDQVTLDIPGTPEGVATFERR